MTRFIPLVLSVLLAVRPLSAQETRSMSLEDALRFGLANNTELIDTRLESDILRERAFEVMTEGFPKISGQLDYNWNFKQQTTVIPAGAFPGQTTDVDATFLQPHIATLQADWQQLVFDARYLYGLQARGLFLDIADHQDAVGEIEARETITRAYYGALVSQQASEVLQQNEAVLETILAETRATYEAGLVDELSVDRLELNLANLRTEITRSRNDAQNALKNLKYVLGMDQNDGLVLTEDLDALLGEPVDGLETTGNVEERVEFQLLSDQVDLRGYDVKQARSAYFPNFYLYGRYGTQAFRNEFDFFDTGQRWFDFGSLGFTMNVTMFDGLAARSKVQQRKLQQQQQANQLRDFEEAYALQVDVARNDLANALARFELQEDNLELAQRIYDKTNIMFREGVGTSLELSQAQADLTTTVVNYTQAAYDVLVARLELDKALGNL